MVCKNCGFENESNAVFCANCGASIEIEEGTSVLFEETQNEQTESYDVQNDYIVPPYSEEQDYSTPVFEAEAYNSGANVGAKKNDGKLPLILGSVALGLSLISSCCCSWIPFVSYITYLTQPASLALAIVALVFGTKAMKQAKSTGEKNTQATVGTILAAVTIGLAIIGLILAIVILVVGGAGMIASEVFGGSYYY